MSKYTVKGMKNILKNNRITDYPSNIRKDALVALLVEKVDPRYELYGMSKKELKTRMESQTGNVGCTVSDGKKTQLIEALWFLEDPGLIFNNVPLSTNTFVFPKSFRLPSRKELTAQYKELTGRKTVKREHRKIETLIKEINRTRNADIANFIGNDPSCALYEDCVQQIFSFVDPEIETNNTRIGMIEDAESYGTKKSIKKMRDYMLYLIVKGNNPETIQVTGELLDFSGYKSHHTAVEWARKFVRYYNTYYRGNPANAEEVLNDLKHKQILTCTMMIDKWHLSWRKQWLSILNFNKESSYLDKRDMLDGYRTEVIPFDKIPRLAVRTFNYERASSNDAARLGSRQELGWMRQTLYRWDEIDNTSLPTLDVLTAVAVQANEYGYHGGDYRGMVLRLVSFLHIDMKELYPNCGITHDAAPLLYKAYDIIHAYSKKLWGDDQR